MGRHFVSKCTAAKPGKDMGQKGQLDKQLVDEWEGKKGFFLSIGRVGYSHFQNVVFIPRPSSAGEVRWQGG